MTCLIQLLKADHTTMKKPGLMNRGTYQVIRVDGTTEERQFDKGRSLIKQIHEVIGCEYADTVNLRDGTVMFVDDLGHRKVLPHNQVATLLYWDVCKPGTTHTIVGVAVIVNDSDFE